MLDEVFSSTEIPLVKGFTEYLEEIQKLGYNTKIVTARDNKESEIANKICEKYGIDIPLLNSNYNSKAEFCKGSVAHIDDSIFNLKKLNGAVENLLLFDKPHNKKIKEDKGIIRKKSWEEVYNFLR